MLHIKSSSLKVDPGLLPKQNTFIKCPYLVLATLKDKEDIWALYQVVVILDLQEKYDEM